MDVDGSRAKAIGTGKSNNCKDTSGKDEGQGQGQDDGAGTSEVDYAIKVGAGCIRS